MTAEDPRPPAPAVPNVARVYDAWLGGRSNYAADRQVAAQVQALAPWVVAAARANRRFVSRAIRFACRRGIRQFVDLGSGLPTMRNVHQVAGEHCPAPRVVYVDRDPVVTAHARALLATDERTGVVQGDLADVEQICADRTFLRLIDPHEPVGLLATAVLHFIPQDIAVAQALSAWREVMAPGSHLVISHVCPGNGSQQLRQRDAVEMYAREVAPFAARTSTQILHLLDGFEPLPPGVVPVQRWRPTSPDRVNWFPCSAPWRGYPGRPGSPPCDHADRSVDDV